MAAQPVNDRFIELMMKKDPLLYEKVFDGGFMVITLNTGELKIFFSGNNLSSEEMNEIMPIFSQAVKEVSEK
ncbi:MAG: hypothetical protein ACHQFX_12910 [Chitinophagales bacterium]